MHTDPTRWATAALHVACAAALALPLAARAANIIDDTHGVGAGSFELGAYVDGGGNPNSAGAGYMGLLPGSTTITGWTVGGPGDGIDWLNAPLYRASAGVHAVDLQHLTKSSIATVIPTVAGASYLLSFFVATTSGGDATGTFSAGTLVDQAFAAVPGSAPGTQTFTAVSAAFTATAAATTITFRSVGSTQPQCTAGISCYGPVIDAVSVTAVPEPGSALLLAGGLFATVGLARRRLWPLLATGS